MATDVPPQEGRAHSLHGELQQATADDAGKERPHLRPDTYMADALVIACAAVPRASPLESRDVQRRLALMRVPEMAPIEIA